MEDQRAGALSPCCPSPGALPASFHRGRSHRFCPGTLHVALVPAFTGPLLVLGGLTLLPLCAIRRFVLQDDRQLYVFFGSSSAPLFLPNTPAGAANIFTRFGGRGQADRDLRLATATQGPSHIPPYRRHPLTWGAEVLNFTGTDCPVNYLRVTPPFAHTLHNA